MDKIVKKAIALKKAERYEEAIGLLKGVKDKTAMHFSLLGSLLWIVDQKENSEALLREGIKSLPKDESVSIALFRILYMQDRQEDAFGEWRRYIKCGEPLDAYNKVNKSIEYEEYMRELVHEFGDHILE